MIIQRDLLGTKTSNGLVKFVVRNTNSGGGTVTIETKCAVVLYELGKLADATATLVATIGNSSTYTGTKTVAYTVAAGKTLEAFIIATNGYDGTLTTSGSFSVDDADLF